MKRIDVRNRESENIILNPSFVLLRFPSCFSFLLLSLLMIILFYPTPFLHATILLYILFTLVFIPVFLKEALLRRF